jgi:flagellar basal body-associated protein FliL
MKNENSNTGQEQTKPKMPNKKLMIIGGIVLVVVVLFGCAIAGFFGNGSTKSVSIEIKYSGPWTGSIGDSNGQRSIQGTGSHSYDVKSGIVTAVIQKSDNGTTPLTVNILEGDNIVETQTTTAEYGVVSVSHSF